MVFESTFCWHRDTDAGWETNILEDDEEVMAVAAAFFVF